MKNRNYSNFLRKTPTRRKIHTKYTQKVDCQSFGESNLTYYSQHSYLPFYLYPQFTADAPTSSPDIILFKIPFWLYLTENLKVGNQLSLLAIALNS